MTKIKYRVGAIILLLIALGLAGGAPKGWGAL